MNKPEDEQDSGDDLDIVYAAKQSLFGEEEQLGSGASVPIRNDRESSTASDGSQNYSEKVKSSDASSEIEWSDEHGQGVYQSFKNRKRKRLIGSNRVKAANTRAESRKKAKREHALDPQRSDSEEKDLMEDTLPEYLKQRKLKFDRRKDRLQHAGLRLPPSYDEVEFSDDERISNLQEKPQFSGIKPGAPYKDIMLPYSLGVIPAPISQWLREYQVQGVAFLHELFVYQKGGILGDDMGLGKTIQVIACLATAFGKTGDERDRRRMRKMRKVSSRPWYPKVLIICPGTLMENWKSEFRKWGWWSVDVFHGSSAVKEAALRAAQKGRLEIMITTYSTYRLNQGAINMIEWDCCIADECHIIKERKSEITQAMHEVNALCRIGLTGTAIQNNYEELWTLLNWTNPGRFGPLSTWKTHISGPLKIGQAHDATIPQLARARETAKKLVQNLLPEFFLRRMKTLLADQLPKKSDRVVFCQLTNTQAEAYENFTTGVIIDHIRRTTDLCQCQSGKKLGWCCGVYIAEEGVTWQTAIFPAIMNLCKLANHVALLVPSGTMAKGRQHKDLETLQAALPDKWRNLYRQRDNIINFANPEFCGKWKILRKLLRFWHANGDKVLVFSHSVRLLRMLQTLFTATTSYNVSFLDGSMSYEDRAKAVDDYNADPAQFVFLISAKAGGVGLNITSANKVVIVDPNWNPSYDLQAQDRAYRIGQVRDVEVFRLISAGTIEEIVYARQIYKQQQANIGYNASNERRYFTGVQNTKEKKGEIFGLQNMFAYHGDNVVLREIVNKTNVAESRAGVNVVGLDNDSTQGEDAEDELDADEHSAMRALEDLIKAGDPEVATEKKKKTLTNPRKTDAVQAILASAGVEYTHENSEVIGTSKIEARLSRRAQEAVDDIDLMNEHVFQTSRGKLRGNVADDGNENADDGTEHEYARNYGANANNNNTGNFEQKITYRYRPREDIRKRQFCTMSQSFGFSDATEFALVVEGWTQAQRRNCLDRFYKLRRTNAEGAKPAA